MYYCTFKLLNAFWTGNPEIVTGHGVSVAAGKHTDNGGDTGPDCKK